MYQSEKQFNTTASVLAIEEAYTNLDIAPNDMYLPYEGYVFCYPQRWLDDPSQNKVIGIRRLNIAATTHTFNFAVIIEDGEVKSQYETGDIKVLKSNKLMEVLNKITTIISKQSANSSGDQYTYEFQYYFENNKLIITCHKITSNSNTILKFKFIANNSFNDFLKFLNQPIDGSLNNSLTTFKDSHVFENVWDREYIEFHATFSDSKRNFIGRGNEFYHKPSLFFKAPNDGSVFHVRFTSDGKTPILPRYCRFIIQLCFLLNYKNAIVK